MQPYLFPYIGYFQLIHSVDKFYFYDDVNFILRGWINRNRLLLGSEEFLFSVPLKEKSHLKTINEVEVAHDVFPEWREKFLKTLRFYYRKAPHFEATYSLIEPVLRCDHRFIVDYAISSARSVMEYLGITTPTVVSSKVYAGTQMYHGT